MFDEPVNKTLPELSEDNIRKIYLQHKLRWIVTMLVAIPGFILVFCIEASVDMPRKFLLVGIGFLSVASYFGAGNIFPMSRFHGSGAVEKAKREVELQKAKEKFLKKKG